MATDGLRTALVHTQAQNIDVGFYKDIDLFFDRSMVWIYMPINQDERVTEICRRLGPGDGRPDFLGLIVRE